MSKVHSDEEEDVAFTKLAELAGEANEDKWDQITYHHPYSNCRNKPD
jgi:hypothetical protein